jgi:hypothetical protein
MIGNCFVSAKPAEARAIAKESYIHGFPMVDDYRIPKHGFCRKLRRHILPPVEAHSMSVLGQKPTS